MSARTLPPWYDEAKLGVMICWTPASVPAFAPRYGFDLGDVALEDRWDEFVREMPDSLFYWNSMGLPDSATARYHAERYGDRSYEELVSEFRAGLHRWDPEPWADLLERAGARYVVLVTKHLDGFLLWPSATGNPLLADWGSRRDIVGEFAGAVRARGIRFGAYYSGGIDWTFGGLPMHGIEDVHAAVPQDARYIEYADTHWRELIERYEPAVIWNDMGYPAAADPDELIGWYRERVPDGVANDRFFDVTKQRGPGISDFQTLENQRNYWRDAPSDRKWEACRAVGSSWGYNRQESDATYTSATELIRELADVVARGGNMLLALTPTATGQVPFGQAKRLLAIGWWLRSNGAAIYGTERWDRPDGVTADGLDVRYTVSAEALHAIVLGQPTEPVVELDLQLDQEARVELEEASGELSWESSEHGVRVRLPELPAENPALVLRVSPRTASRPASSA